MRWMSSAGMPAFATKECRLADMTGQRPHCQSRPPGLTAQVEQKMEAGEPAPGSVRPLRRADVHIIEPSGSEIWIDVPISHSGQAAKQLCTSQARLPLGGYLGPAHWGPAPF